jgi:hypothetical protein
MPIPTKDIYLTYLHEHIGAHADFCVSVMVDCTRLRACCDRAKATGRRVSLAAVFAHALALALDRSTLWQHLKAHGVVPSDGPVAVRCISPLTLRWSPIHGAPLWN